MRCLWDSRIQAQGSLTLGRYLGGGQEARRGGGAERGEGEGKKKREDKRGRWEIRKDEERWGERRREESDTKFEVEEQREGRNVHLVWVGWSFL